MELEGDALPLGDQLGVADRGAAHALDVAGAQVQGQHPALDAADVQEIGDETLARLTLRRITLAM